MMHSKYGSFSVCSVDSTTGTLWAKRLLEVWELGADSAEYGAAKYLLLAASWLQQ